LNGAGGNGFAVGVTCLVLAGVADLRGVGDSIALAGIASGLAFAGAEVLKRGVGMRQVGDI
jgi:hypothetical protein